MVHQSIHHHGKVGSSQSREFDHHRGKGFRIIVTSLLIIAGEFANHTEHIGSSQSENLLIAVGKCARHSGNLSHDTCEFRSSQSESTLAHHGVQTCMSQWAHMSPHYLAEWQLATEPACHEAHLWGWEDPGVDLVDAHPEEVEHRHRSQHSGH